MTTPAAFEIETVALDALHAHPRNYREHDDVQLDHLCASITQHGLYRNIVIARDNTILAGHGVTLAAARLGLSEVPVIRLDLDPDSPRALKVLAGDNEIAHLGIIDDRMLSEMLKEIQVDDLEGLLGTGYDEMMLANLVYVTRPESEIARPDHAAHWAGMPEYDNADALDVVKLTVTFRTRTDRETFVTQHDLRIDKREARVWSTWWPYKPREETASLRFTPSSERGTPSPDDAPDVAPEPTE